MEQLTLLEPHKQKTMLVWNNEHLGLLNLNGEYDESV